MTESKTRGSPIAGLRLLLVEDDPALMDEYRRVLEELGCVLTVAASAEEGVEAARSAPFDAILTDNVLAKMSGLRSITEYAKSTRAPVLLMTSHYSGEVERDALLLGAKRVLAKPIVWDAAVAVLAAVAL